MTRPPGCAPRIGVQAEACAKAKRGYQGVRAETVIKVQQAVGIFDTATAVFASLNARSWHHEEITWEMQSMSRALMLAAALLVLLQATQVAAEPICKPVLAVKNVGFSEMINLKRFWTATVHVDASRCATSFGLFALAFVRLAEMVKTWVGPLGVAPCVPGDVASGRGVSV